MMSKLKNHVLNVTGFSIVIVALLLAGSQVGNALPSDKDVRVVNTTAEPVPTAAQGTTTIAGNVSVTNTIGVNVTNTVGVNVTNTPTVNLSSGATVGIDPAHNTVKVASTLQPFQAFKSFSETFPSNVTTVTLATVPAGKRLVIEYVAFSGQVPPTEHVETMDITTMGGGTGAQFLLQIQPQPAAVSGDALFSANGPVKIYADPGTTVQSTVRRSSSVGSASYGLAISGYLVDM